MEKYAFFLDIDGTLSKSGVIHPDNMKVIKKAQELGHYVLINTGRSYAYIPPHVFECADFDGFVCGLGADIRVRGEQIQSKNISKELVMKIAELFLKLDDKVGLIEGEDHVYYTRPWYDIVNERKVLSPSDFETKYKDAKISKFTCETMNKDLLEPFLDEIVIFDQNHYFELAQKGCNKAVGMMIAANHLEIPKERCVAIGDSINDEDMLRAAGIAVVMENGDERMKKIATFVTDDVNNAGVARAIEKILRL